jgi:hypothetical protein
MSKMNYNRTTGASFCPRASAQNVKDYEERKIEKIGKAAYYAIKGRKGRAVEKRECDSIYYSREYHQKKRETKIKLERLKMIKQIANRDLL